MHSLMLSWHRRSEIFYLHEVHKRWVALDSIMIGDIDIVLSIYLGKFTRWNLVPEGLCSSFIVCLHIVAVITD